MTTHIAEQRRRRRDYPTIGRARGARCAKLDDHAKPCGRPARVWLAYHGEPEIYRSYSDDEGVMWVRVPLCWRHSDAAGGPANRMQLRARLR